MSFGNPSSRAALIGVAVACVVASRPVCAADPAAAPIIGLSAGQVFELARSAEQAGDDATASEIYGVMARDPNADVRSEARFRHSLLLSAKGKYVDAALLLRAILDEKPDAQRVRLELAKVQALMGDQAGAYRSLRQAQAGGLPPDVSVLVKQFTLALRSYKPIGASFELVLAPDTNINRTTSSDMIDTVIAPLQLDAAAQKRSGLGVKPSGQIYGRIRVQDGVSLVPRLFGQGSLYRQSDFNDVIGGGALDLEYGHGRSFYTPSIGRSYRWYGGRHYSSTNTASIRWRRLLDKTSQLQVSAAAGRTHNAFNRLQSGTSINGSLTYERAFSARSGGSITALADRQGARDAGYATTAAGANALYYREIGAMTLYVSANYQHLRADARLLLFRARREDDYVRFGIGALFRDIEVSGFSPVVRIGREINRSTVGLYRYRRTVFEVGVARTF